MEIWIRVLILAAAVILLVLAALRSRYELHHLTTARYEIESDRIRREDSLRLVLLSDLHGRSYGEKNADLLARIRKEAPDAIVCAGDMITAGSDPAYAESAELLRALSAIAPVYASYGNHEKKMSLEEGAEGEAFASYRSETEAAGVCWLTNTGLALNPSVFLSGLDTDFLYYRKIRRRFYPLPEMKKDLACAANPMFNIILAHNPRFLKTYAAFGADLVLAGHYHGGAVRIPGLRVGLVSPQFRPFPRYSRGLYQKGKTKMIVSAGCGSHKVNLRLFNKPEIVVIQIHGNLV